MTVDTIDPRKALGRVKRIPAQIDLFSGELVTKKPKRGRGDHIKLRSWPGEPPVVPGMAHYPGTGPEKTYCHDCAHYGDIPIYRGGQLYAPPRDPEKRPIAPLRIQKGACEKAARLMDGYVQRGKLGANRSCKYFTPKTSAG